MAARRYGAAYESASDSSQPRSSAIEKVVVLTGVQDLVADEEACKVVVLLEIVHDGAI